MLPVMPHRPDEAKLREELILKAMELAQAYTTQGITAATQEMPSP